MAHKGFLVKLIFLLHLMGVSHLSRSALTDCWHLMGGWGRGGAVWVQQQNLENALACDLSHQSNKSQAAIDTRAVARIRCNVLACSPRIWPSWTGGEVFGAQSLRLHSCLFSLSSLEPGFGSHCAEVSGLQFDQSPR